MLAGVRWSCDQEAYNGEAATRNFKRPWSFFLICKIEEILVTTQGQVLASQRVNNRRRPYRDSNALDSRRLEVVADGLTLWHGAQLAINTTLVSPLRRDGTARRRAANHDGAALEEARQRKERTYLELSGDGGRARLVVLAAEVGGRWSRETAEFLCALAKARAQSEPLLLQGRAQAAWLRRWSAMLACSAARSFPMSLLDHDAENEVRFRQRSNRQRSISLTNIEVLE